jgi:hypothetical protein
VTVNPALSISTARGTSPEHPRKRVRIHSLYRSPTRRLSQSLLELPIRSR